MINDILNDVSYKNLMENQVYEMCEYLINKDEYFSITANINGVSFNPEIPQSIKEQFSAYTLFSLMNYTYDTVVLTQDDISFEAGFGSENFGSKVTIPLNAIFQVIVDESILLINPTATIEKHFAKKEEEELENLDQKSRSLNAFKMNNKNKNLF